MSNTIPLFVSMFTDLYRTEAATLEHTLKTYDLEYEIIRIENHGSWLANVQQKAEVVRMAMFTHYRPIIWLDADARVQMMPHDLLTMPPEVDFAAYFIPNVFKIAAKRPWGPHRGKEALAGGTLYFGDGDEARELAISWVKMCEERPGAWEQQNLQRVLGKTLDKPQPWAEPINCHWLPQSYCKVFDRKWYPGEKGPIVIEHMQASRRLRKQVT